MNRFLARGAVLLLLPCAACGMAGLTGPLPFDHDGGASTSDGGPPPPAIVVANAGADQLVPPAAQVFLDAAGSFATDRQPLTYLWSQVDGPTVTLSDPTAIHPRFRAPAAPGRISFLLTATDGQVSASDVVQIVVRAGASDRAPFPVAGPDQETAPGMTVRLDASASSDPDGDPLTYLWRRADGTKLADGPTATFLAPDTPGPVALRLEVNDGTLSAKDDLVLFVDDPLLGQRAPVATADAPTAVDPGTQVTLTGHATDPDGDPVRLSWRQIGGPPVVLADHGAVATFTAPRRVVHLAFLLSATDGRLSSAPVPVSVDVGAGTGNTAPIAVATAPATATAGTQVTLDGTGSHDPNNDVLVAYAWIQLGGTPVTLLDPTAPVTTFLAPTTPGTLTFALTVFDGQVYSAPAVVQIDVTAP